MKSIFLGNRIECLRILQRYSDVKKVVTNKGSFVDKYFKNNKKKFLIENNNPNKINKIIKYGDEKLIVSAGYPRIIPKQFIPKNKIIINSHPSLLPKYKGMQPIRDAIKSGEKIIGATTHFITKDLDSGKIIKFKKYYINKRKNIDSIHDYLFSIIEPINLRESLKNFIKK